MREGDYYILNGRKCFITMAPLSDYAVVFAKTDVTKGSRGLSAYLSGVTEEMMQQERDQVLDATQEDIRALAPLVRAILNTGSFCVVGNEEKIESRNLVYNGFARMSVGFTNWRHVIMGGSSDATATTLT